MTGLSECVSFTAHQTETRHSASIAMVLENADDTARAYWVEVNWSEDNRSLFSGTLQLGETYSEKIATTDTAPESAQFLIDTANSAQSGTWSPTDCPDYRVDAVIENRTPSFDTTCQA